MAKKNLKKICPKAFAPIAKEYKPSAYSEEERYKMFVERKVVAPKPHVDKTKYNRKKARQNKKFC